ncbi:hypothetical protein O0L34_g5027 [Tuta absoluta]|nr:hypothetical protein O0L34_g5027 [Tuta absoluta]
MIVCRVCLSTSVNRDIRELKTTKKEDSKSYLEILRFCFDFIQVAEESKTTTKLCNKCFRKILGYHKFKTLALQSDTYLKTVKVKLEKVVVKDEEQCNNSDASRIDNYYVEQPCDDDNIDNTYYEDEIELDEIIGKNIKDEPEIKVENDYQDLLSNIKTIEDDDFNTVIINPPLEADVDKHIFEITFNKSNGPVNITATAKCKREFGKECGKSVRAIKTPSVKHKKGCKDLPCRFCDKIFSSYKSRSRHKKLIHLRIESKCTICGKKVTNLSDHMLRLHNPERPKHLQCEICYKNFKLPSLFELHNLEHTKENPFECDLCQKEFGTAKNLLIHKRRVHDKEKPHLCQYCSKQFFKKDKLTEHLRSHTGERPYECEECGKAFYTGHKYRIHKETHSDVKNFECDYCNAKFSMLRYLRNHMLCHTKEKRYPCKYCGVKFGRSDHRNRHQFTAHEKHLGTPLGLPDKADQYAIKSRSNKVVVAANE